MSFDSFFNSLWLDADVTLGGGGAGVLQQPLYQGNVISAVLVNLGGIPLPEAVSADALEPQIVADDVKLLLDGSLRDRKDGGGALDTVSQAVVLFLGEIVDIEGVLSTLLEIVNVFSDDRLSHLAYCENSQFFGIPTHKQTKGLFVTCHRFFTQWVLRQ